MSLVENDDFNGGRGPLSKAKIRRGEGWEDILAITYFQAPLLLFIYLVNLLGNLTSWFITHCFNFVCRECGISTNLIFKAFGLAL